METLQFNIAGLELIEEVSNSQFAKVRIKTFADGDNAHGMPVQTQALKNAEKSIINKPVTYVYDILQDDASTHSKTKEIPCGFVSPENANISYELTDDGRLMFCVDALIWKYYSGRMFEIFKRDGIKSVSVVITLIEKETNEDGKVEISSFCYNAITVLGDKFNPAVPDAQAELIEFSKAKEEFENQMFAVKNQDLQQVDHDIDNNLIESKNKEKEVINTMEFDKVEFAKVVGMTAEQMRNMLYSACREKKYTYENDTYGYTKYYLRDYSAEYVFAYDNQYDTIVALSYSMEDGKPNIDFESPKSCMMTYVVDEGEPQTMGFAEVVKDVVERKDEVFAVEKETLTKELDETKVKFSEVEVEKENVSKELEELKVSFATIDEENKALKEFKSNVEETEKQNKIEFAINTVAEDLSQDQIQEWKNKVSEFENVEAFANAIQSFAYGLTKKNGKKKKSDEEVSRIAVPNSASFDKPKTIWDELKGN